MNILKRAVSVLCLYIISYPAMAIVNECMYFKSAVQTWDDSRASLDINAPSYVKNAHGSDQVGFKGIQIEGNHDAACRISDTVAKECIGSESLIVEKPDFSQTQFLGEKGYVSVRASDTITPGSYKSLTISTGSKEVIQVEPGEYWIEDFLLSGEEQLIFSNTERTVIHVGRLSRSGGARFNHTGKSDNLIIKAYNSVFGHAQISMNGVGSFNGLIISEYEFEANADIEVIGAVTAPQITLSNGARVIAKGDCFSEKPQLELRISPTTDSGTACDGIPITFSLVNSDTDQVVVGSGQTLAVTSAPHSGSNTACWSENGSITTNQCTPNSDHGFIATFARGQAASITWYIHSKFLNDYNVRAMVASEDLEASSGPYRFSPSSLLFLPEGIDGGEDRQVAHRPFAARFKLSGSTGNGNQLNCNVVDYDSLKEIQLDNAQLPTDSPHNLQVSIDSGRTWQSANTTLSLTFTDGVAGGNVNAADGSILFKLNDAGVVDLKATAFSFGKYLEVTKRIHFRPFALALCDSNGALPHATEESNGGFAASGSDVTSYLKAFGWVNTLDSNNNGIPDNNVTATGLCGEAETPSYYTHSGFPAIASFSQPEVIYPASGSRGNLTLDGILLPSASVEITSSDRNKSRLLNWDEVGTVAVSASQANYMGLAGFNIPGVSAQVGRFYPKYFKTVNTPVWDYPNEQTFAYMNQPFNGVIFDVEALNAKEESVSNYAYFEESLTANFALFEPDFSDRFNAPTPSKSWALNSGRSIGTFTLNKETLSADCESELCWKKAETSEGYEDGPFNTSGGEASRISITQEGLSNIDPVAYPSSTEGNDPQLLPSQPDIRFGRAVIDSVGGTIDNGQTIPLRLEFWNGTHFVTNDDDSTTYIAGINVVSSNKSIWVESGKTAADVNLENGGVVENGESNTITASQNASVRQQTQVWLELDSGVRAAPWLRYRWDDDYRPEVNGEEDPSTIITFGIYRGNDRIIFRGEPRLFAH